MSLDTESPLVEHHHGTIVVNPPPTVGHSALVMAATAFLRNHFAASHVVSNSIGVALADEDRFIPDVVVLDRPIFDVPPDLTWLPTEYVVLVVEVVSLSSRVNDHGYKRDVYMAAGIPLIIIDPIEHSVRITGHTDFEHDELARGIGWHR